MAHSHPHAFSFCRPLQREGLVVGSRRNFLKASLAGIGGLSLPGLLRERAQAAQTGQPRPSGKSVILLWMTGGPSQIDTWDPKPDRPAINRGPFAPIATRVPGIRISEYLPKQADMMDRFSILRSVDATNSNHARDNLFQTGAHETLLAQDQSNVYPAMGSIVSKHHGPNRPGMPSYAAFMVGRSHVAGAGWLGRSYEPFVANQAVALPMLDNVGKDLGKMSEPSMFRLASGINFETLNERRALQQQFDGLRAELDRTGVMEAQDRFGEQALEMLVGRRAQAAFDLSREPDAVRARYGKHLWCQQALLARRMVEAGSAFVTLDLSYHSASGTWDTHGDNIPPYGGIWNGLRPLLPLFDHLLTTLVSDLEQRGLLENTLVVAMGEFGRTPMMGTQDSTDGRNHWPVVMSMCLAGGGLNHGQVIGATDATGGHIKERRITPGDLAATIYHHFGIPLETTYNDPTGRPRPLVADGQPMRELL